MSDDTTDFGFQRVPLAEKSKRVGAVFDSVVDRYDLMNDVMSLGIHRLWKRFALQTSGIRRGQRVLDLAGGTGDLAARLARLVGAHGEVVLCDINAAMLERGRRRLIDEGITGNMRYVQGSAQYLPFPENSFNCVTMAFGLRNVTDKSAALASIYRVLKPGGRVLILEFSRPVVPGLKPVYDLYSFRVLPVMGRLIAGDADSYRYLAESIHMHPDQQEMLSILEEAGFERCHYHNLTGGIVALHSGYKL
jgi:demethylmenaquinone methyltransferase/2-methoxy-6-polyprenyl-1,4-benzoquinol methylase